MKDKASSKTRDSFPVKRGRGRPVTGKAMTHAERQMKYRERIKAKYVTKSDDKGQGVDREHLLSELEAVRHLLGDVLREAEKARQFGDFVAPLFRE